MPSNKLTKADLEKRIKELEAELRDTLSELETQELNGEAIEECRGLLAEVGHRGTFFTEVVQEAVTEIKARRYDASRYERFANQLTQEHPDTVKRQKPKRTDADGVALWVATWPPSLAS